MNKTAIISVSLLGFALLMGNPMGVSAKTAAVVAKKTPAVTVKTYKAPVVKAAVTKKVAATTAKKSTKTTTKYKTNTALLLSTKMAKDKREVLEAAEEARERAIVLQIMNDRKAAAQAGNKEKEQS